MQEDADTIARRRVAEEAKARRAAARRGEARRESREREQKEEAARRSHAARCESAQPTAASVRWGEKEPVSRQTVGRPCRSAHTAASAAFADSRPLATSA